MSWIRLGRQLRAVRLRSRLRQADVARLAHVSRSAVSLIETGRAERLSVRVVEAVVAAVGARLEPRLLWHGAELDRLADAGHAALAASVKRRLERWGWAVRVEVSYNHYGERGRIDLLGWHATARVVLVVEIKTSIADVQALLGSEDTKVRIAPRLVSSFGWSARKVVPAIVFLEDRTTRRHLDQLGALFDRYALRGRAAVAWARRPGGGQEPPSGVLWLQDLPSAGVVRVSGQRVRNRTRWTAM
jgi:transcriptional regulator with XRE-family HTH domain